MSNADRLVPLTTFGYVAAALGVGLIFLGTLLDPAFSWQSRSLSSIGEATDAGLLTLDRIAFLVFNGGLALGGLLGLPFVYRLSMDAETTADRIGVVWLAVSLLGMIGVAVAYLDGPLAGLHFLFALTFFLAGTLGVWFYSSGQALRGHVRRGVLGIWVGNAHILGWVVWIMLEAFLWGDDGDTWTYFAAIEFVGALLFGGWIFWTARGLAE
jgi:hypothetical membrane protein